MNHLLKKILLTSTALTISLGLHASEPSPELKASIAKIGNIKEFKETQTKGMFAWMLEKNGKTLVLYNTPDNKHFIKGDIYDLKTKKLTSNQYALDSLKYASPDFRNKVLGITTPSQISAKANNESKNPGYMNIKWNQKTIPEALKLVDSLKGAKEGKGLPQDTLYIFYDPNCTWCHATYDHLRPYVEKGYTIKWLPTLARGRSASAIALNSAPLQNPKNLAASFERSPAALATTPTEQNIKDIDQNLQFLFAYFKKVLPEERPTVPFGIFLNKSNGKVTHVQGLSEQPIIELMYGSVE